MSVLLLENSSELDRATCSLLRSIGFPPGLRPTESTVASSLVRGALGRGPTRHTCAPPTPRLEPSALRPRPLACPASFTHSPFFGSAPPPPPTFSSSLPHFQSHPNHNTHLFIYVVIYIHTYIRVYIYRILGK